MSDEDVLDLYWLTADDADAGATILATLEAAAEHGLAGARPLRWARWSAFETDFPAALSAPVGSRSVNLILGADLPGPHALCDDGAAWWSWGEPYDPASFPGAVIEEAWAVTW